MPDLETPWATPEGVPSEAQWFDEGPFTQGGEAFVEESWAAETPLAEVPLPEARTDERWPESPFETPVEGFVEEGAAGQSESFSDTGILTQGEGVPGCGAPVSGTPPLIYRSSSPDRSRNPWVGRAQTLLNVFLARQRASTESCSDQTAATKGYIATLRTKLAALGQDPLRVDCVFGEGTETATMMFQACRALLRDGKIGEKTWPELLALETTPPVPSPAPVPAPVPTPTPAIRERQDVWTLSTASTWHPTILWYARGVAALQARNGATNADPRSWLHLAETHGTFVTNRTQWPTGARWRQCEHNSWHFLPWHRIYLHHFERIMREEVVRLGGPADWALPFWNYSDDTSRPEVTMLPPAFKAPSLPDGSPNPLLVTARATAMNGTGRLNAAVVQTVDAFAETTFSPASGPTGGFGGTRAPVGSHRGGPGSQLGVLERVPHGLVHTGVGGPGGLMSLFETAARDPIFWLHHANIDRLWDAWLRARPGNRNPADSSWLDASWTFGSGSTTTTMRTRQVLDPRQPPLGYRYSDMPLAPTPEAEWFEEEPRQEEDARPAELVGASEHETPLGTRATTARVRLGRPSGPSARRLEETGGVPSGVKVYLRLENVRGTRIHASGVEVFLNIPAGGRPADFPDRRAGVLPMFGVIETSRRDDHHSGGGLTTTFDVTRAARSLATSGQWDPAKVDVTFVPIPDATGAVGIGDVAVGRISVFYA